MQRVVDAIEEEIKEEKARHAAVIKKLEHLRDLVGVEPIAKNNPKTREPRANSNKGKENEKRVVDALAEGPLQHKLLVQKSGVPIGSISAVLERLAAVGAVIRPKHHGEPWQLPNGKPTEVKVPDDLRNRVLEVLSGKRLGTAGLARELGVTIETVTDLTEHLEHKGDITQHGHVWETKS